MLENTIVVIDDNPTILGEVFRIIEMNVEGVELLCLDPSQLRGIPENVEVFVVDFDTGAISVSEIIRKIRGDHKKARVIVWGVPLDPSGEEKILLFEAGANFIIDKYVENIATVIKSALKEPVRKPKSVVVRHQFGW